MKYLYLPLILLVASCGRIDVTGVGGSRVGEALTVSPFSDTDRTNLSAICNALASKAIVQNSTLNFKAYEGDCTQNTVSDGDVQVAVQGTNLIRKVDGRQFIFPDIETANSGLLADVCNNLSNFQNPINTGSELITVNTTGIDPADCSPRAEQICVRVYKASVVNGNSVIHTKDWMRVKVSDVSNTGKVGYFFSRKKVTRSFCGVNEALTFKADLK